MSKVCIVNGSTQYANLLIGLGFQVTDSPLDAELIVFTGGEDVSPSLYGDKQHVYTGSNMTRDAVEGKVFDYAKKKGIPMLGICRGGQFLNVKSGGRMYQHVGKHTSSHFITDAQTGEQVWASSTHHQMMMPGQDAITLAFSTLGGEREWYDGQVFMRDVSNTDYEILFYPDTQCLCVQPHPEFYGAEYQDLRDYLAKLIHTYLGL